ncbi:MAG: DsbA family protein [Proteobacteria bacterium]|nr:DsbA family protein [Pseudomonadota bacterium]
MMMKPRTLSAFCLTLVLLVGAALPSLAKEEKVTLPERALGKADAPVLIEEYASFTCSHCTVFNSKVFPKIEEKYINTGKVRWIYHDFPLDGVGLKASALAQCMPKDSYFPFLKILSNNFDTWIRSTNHEATLQQYAQMAGLPAEKAKVCIEDTAMMDAIVAERTKAIETLDIKATPTFVINKGADIVLGHQSFAEFSAMIERHLAAKKK